MLTDLINVYRQNSLCNVAQKELKKVIEIQFQYDMGENNGLVPYEIELGKTAGKIPMIKEVRTRTGLSLKEAKDLCEEYFTQHGLDFYSSCGYNP